MTILRSASAGGFISRDQLLLVASFQECAMLTSDFLQRNNCKMLLIVVLGTTLFQVWSALGVPPIVFFTTILNQLLDGNFKEK